MRKRLLILPALLASAVLSLSAVPQAVFAHDSTGDSSSSSGSGSGSDSSDGSSEDSHNTTSKEDQKAKEQAREQVKKLQEQRTEAAKERLEAAREKAKQDGETKKNEAFKKSCDNRAGNFKGRLENIGSRAQKQQEKLDAIVQRVMAFKESKNLDVADYDALVAAVNTKKQVVADLVAATQKAGEGFTCGDSSDEAKANLATFKDAMQQQINAMKEYRTAVKNLITAVKTAAEAAKEDTSNGQ